METIEKLKARLVAESFKQKEEIDFFDTFSHVTKVTSIRLLISIATMHNLMIYQMDLKMTFFKWRFRRRNLHEPTRRFYNAR